jgi:hypothetical protein
MLVYCLLVATCATHLATYVDNVAPSFPFPVDALGISMNFHTEYAKHPAVLEASRLLN